MRTYAYTKHLYIPNRKEIEASQSDQVSPPYCVDFVCIPNMISATINSKPKYI